MIYKKLLIPLVASLSVDNFVCILADAEEKITSNINAVYAGKYDALDTNIVMLESGDAIVSNEKTISSNIDIAYGKKYDAFISSLHAHESTASKNRNREEVSRQQLRGILGDRPVTEQQRSLGLLDPVTSSVELITGFFNNGLQAVNNRLQELDGSLGAMLEDFQKQVNASVVALVNDNIEKILPAKLQLGSLFPGGGIIDFKDILGPDYFLDVNELYVSFGSINGLNSRLKMTEFVTTAGEQFHDGPFNELFEKLKIAVKAVTGRLEETIIVSSSISVAFKLLPGVTIANASFNYDVSKDVILVGTLTRKGNPTLEIVSLSLPSIPIIDLKAILTYGPDEGEKKLCARLQFEAGPNSRNFEGGNVVVGLKKGDYQNLGPLEALIGDLLRAGTALLSFKLPTILGDTVGLVQDEIIGGVNTLLQQVCI